MLGGSSVEVEEMLGDGDGDIQGFPYFLLRLLHGLVTTLKPLEPPRQPIGRLDGPMVASEFVRGEHDENEKEGYQVPYREWSDPVPE